MVRLHNFFNSRSARPTLCAAFAGARGFGFAVQQPKQVLGQHYTR